MVLFHYTYEKAESQVKSEVSQVEVSRIQKLVLVNQYALAISIQDSFLSPLPAAFSVIFDGLKQLMNHTSPSLVFLYYINSCNLIIIKNLSQILYRWENRVHTYTVSGILHLAQSLFHQQQFSFTFSAEGHLRLFIIISKLFSFFPPYSSHSLLHVKLAQRSSHYLVAKRPHQRKVKCFFPLGILPPLSTHH